MSDRNDVLSLHLVGERFDGSGIFVKPIPPGEDTTDPATVLTMRHFIINCGDARPVGIIRTRKDGEGKLEYFKSSFTEPMTARDEEVLDGIVCRIACDNTGFIETRDGAEKVLEVIDFMEQLGEGN